MGLRDIELSNKALVIMIVIALLCIFGSIIIFMAYFDLVGEAKEYIRTGTIDNDIQKYCNDFRNGVSNKAVKINNTVYVDFNHTFVNYDRIINECIYLN